MPLYEYRCTGCGTIFDRRAAFSESDDCQSCPACGKPAGRKLTPIPHRWPSNHHPNLEGGGQREFLDPERQARLKDNVARMKEEGV